MIASPAVKYEHESKTLKKVKRSCSLSKKANRKPQVNFGSLMKMNEKNVNRLEKIATTE